MSGIEIWQSALYSRLRLVQVWGANTGVGKTVVSTALCRALLSGHEKKPKDVLYLKPVSTGPLSAADDDHVARFTIRYGQRLRSRTLFQFSKPVSPHIAAWEGKDDPPTDSFILRRLTTALSAAAERDDEIALVETAGGVLSPAPSGTLQADLYRPLRIPGILVGDSRLGGIGATIAAFESLRIRGFDVNDVVMFHDDGLGNEDFLRKRFSKSGVQLHTIPPPPPQLVDDQEIDHQRMAEYYENCEDKKYLKPLVDHIALKHHHRLVRLKSLPRKANELIWHPFTQHKNREEKSIVTIDSAYGDFFHTTSTALVNSTSTDVAANVPDIDISKAALDLSFDGSGSWWSQGLGHGNIDLSLSAAYAAGRYGHVMFAGAIHEPGLRLAENLIQQSNGERLKKVFYTDNGSTGVEVALKMALTASSKRYGWKLGEDIEILGLRGGYHGDTIAAMDCCEPSDFNKVVNWYQGRGIWLDYPSVTMEKGVWKVKCPESIEYAPREQSFGSLKEIFDFSGRSYEGYYNYIKEILKQVIEIDKRKIGALIMEPVLLGAGGMVFPDPLFQHALVKVVRQLSFSTAATQEMDFNSGSDKLDKLSWAGLPIISDEVFTGVYRLGCFNSSQLLKFEPDISVHAKLLTGGLLPLSVTLVSQSIFDAFLGNEKSAALLHGHSYTAHPVGCEVALKSLEMFKDMHERGHWKQFKSSWMKEGDLSDNAEEHHHYHHPFWSTWSRDFVVRVSHNDKVEGAIALGSVFAFSLRDAQGGGYSSNATAALQQRLYNYKSEWGNWNVHSRVLGNVLYLISNLNTTRSTLQPIEDLVLSCLEDL